jgi:drug/metabolite transporter (DMT)-like permease
MIETNVTRPEPLSTAPSIPAASPLLHVAAVAGLGAFWGASPALNKLLGLYGVPVGHILVISGFGVGLGLMLLQWLLGGRLQLSRSVLLYGLGCGLLLNIPWGLSLAAIRHVPVTLSAVIVSTTPLCTYALALLLRRERADLLRLVALGLGFLSCVVLILNSPAPPGVLAGAPAIAVDGWLLITLALPVLYAFYNLYTAMAWPKGMTAMTAGVVESHASALMAVPFVLAMEPLHLGGSGIGYWLLAAVSVMWVVERVCFFTLIERTGPVTTVQAVYVSTPASVVLGLVFFAEPANLWLAVSLVLLMAALWLNNVAVTRAGQA